MDTGIVLRVLRDTASVQKLCQRDSRQARFRPSRSRAHCTSARPRYLSQTFSTWRTVPRAMRRWPRSRPTLRPHYAHTTPEPRPGTTTRAEPGPALRPHYAHTTPEPRPGTTTTVCKHVAHTHKQNIRRLGSFFNIMVLLCMINYPRGRTRKAALSGTRKVLAEALSTSWRRWRSV